MTDEQKFNAKMKHYDGMMFFARCLFFVSMVLLGGVIAGITFGGLSDGQLMIIGFFGVVSGVVGLLMADSNKDILDFDEEE